MVTRKWGGFYAVSCSRKNSSRILSTSVRISSPETADSLNLSNLDTYKETSLGSVITVSAWTSSTVTVRSSLMANEWPGKSTCGVDSATIPMSTPRSGNQPVELPCHRQRRKDAPAENRFCDDEPERLALRIQDSLPRQPRADGAFQLRCGKVLPGENRPCVLRSLKQPRNERRLEQAQQGRPGLKGLHLSLLPAVPQSPDEPPGRDLRGRFPGRGHVLGLDLVRYAYGREDAVHVRDARSDTPGLDLGELGTGHGSATGNCLGFQTGRLPQYPQRCPEAGPVHSPYFAHQSVNGTAWAKAASR